MKLRSVGKCSECSLSERTFLMVINSDTSAYAVICLQTQSMHFNRIILESVNKSPYLLSASGFIVITNSQKEIRYIFRYLITVTDIIH